MFELRSSLLVTAATAALLGTLACVAQAQIGALPGAMQQALQAPNADVEAVSENLATSSPAYSTPLLQSSVTLLGGTTNASANEVKAFADLATKLDKPGTDHNAALAAALAIAVENVVGDGQNANLVGGPFAGIIAAAKAEADAVLQDREVQQAILDHAPGTEGTLQAAVNGGGVGGFGSFGGAGGGSGGGSSPAHL